MNQNLNEVEIFEGLFDEETNVFRNVKILGLKSQNGYSYDAKAAESAVGLYEGAPVYIDHQIKGNRSYNDRIGYVENSRWVETEQNVRGDLVLNPHHPRFAQCKFDAQNKSKNVGLSHSIIGRMNSKTKIIESISKVESVDIVSCAATTSSFYEQEFKEQEDHDIKLQETIQSLQKEVEELKIKLNSLPDQFNEVIKGLKVKEKPEARAYVPQVKPTSYEDFIKNLKS